MIPDKHELLKRIEELERLLENKNKEIENANYAGGLFSHEMRNYLLVVNASIFFLGEMPDEQKKSDMLKLSISAQKLTNLLEEMDNYRKAGYEIKWQSLSEIFEGCFNLHSSIKINILKDNILILSTPIIKIIMSSMVNNTYRHGGEKVSNVNIFWREVQSGIIVVYEDDGVGISTNEKNNIFDKGFGKNGGMGLYWVKKILNKLGYSIVENGIHGKGARFEIFIPEGSYKLY